MTVISKENEGIYSYSHWSLDYQETTKTGTLKRQIFREKKDNPLIEGGGDGETDKVEKNKERQRKRNDLQVT